VKSHTYIHQVIRVIALLAFALGIQPVGAQGTAFTYQGMLSSSNAPFSGSAEFQFVLWDSASGGNAVATNNSGTVIATVSSGLFTATLDFGINPFDGSPRFLEASVRTVIGPFTTLTPRQPLTATPYALRALNLTSNGLAGAYGNAVTLGNTGNSFAGTFTGTVSGTVSGDGTGLANVNAATVGGFSASGFWQTDGNTGANPTNGAFIGTTDNLPLEFRANGQRILRLEPTGANQSPNVIGGISFNVVDSGVVGSTISGGGTIVGPGLGPNRISANLATIGGGSQNTNQGQFGTIGGGGGNNINPDSFSFATIAGGDGNKIQSGAEFSTIGGGAGNIIGVNSSSSLISGGNGNTISSNTFDSAIGGGIGNTVAAGNTASSINGGDNNTILQDGGFFVIGGGLDNLIGGPGSTSLSLAGCSTIGGGDANTIRTNADFGTISGGVRNLIGTNADFVTIAGGRFNIVSNTSSASVISGGDNNGIGSNTLAGVISGGISNAILANASFAIIPGGDSNAATNNAFAAGRRAKANHTGAFVWGDSNNADVTSTNANSVTMRAAGGYRLFSNSGATAGVSLAPGGTAWAVISDRNVKKDFAAVNSRVILEKLADMPITQWHYQWEETAATPHIGPMAQDFKAAFYPGTDDKSITTQEADGVELAAIQGLNQKLEEKDARIAAMEKELSEIKETLAKLTKQKE
jgi:hypothetical protein